MGLYATSIGRFITMVDYGIILKDDGQGGVMS
jgi:hypothetical protein